jgi:hypothetical protein
MSNLPMTPRVKRNPAVFVLFGLMAVSLGGLLILPPIPQDQSYHQFADQRLIFGLPNFWNVVSNIPFLVVGAVGMRRCRGDPTAMVFFLGVFLTGIGSSYYHWDPNDDTLFWDRLPMGLSFAAIFALAVEERVSTRAGAILLWPSLAVSLFSLLLWRWTDDLRLYFWGTVLSRPYGAVVVRAVPASVHRHILLDCRWFTLCNRQGV